MMNGEPLLQKTKTSIDLSQSNEAETDIIAFYIYMGGGYNRGFFLK